ncbi:SDR family NAD(P)-dependent oxidoreductase [Aliikangiella sp. IMCC44359]|uniref:SDR family NAD(P)-dependent oxidoreductase n=1 Tax=Aliikangiella sp. IMCC44359 TaxID=3459125 RepID=UPI00403AF73C
MNDSKQENNFSLVNKVAVVTGGGTGIGKAIAQTFANAGALVIVVGRQLETIQAVADETNGRAITCDVTNMQQVEALFNEIINKYGQLDVLVNNAGQSGPVANLSEVNMQAWRECVDVNLFGVIHCLQAAAKIMTQQGSGSIINMSSLMGLQGYPMRSAYSATKFAIIGVTQAIAREVGPYGVRVNAICPGAVSGELMDKVIAKRAVAEKRPASDIIKENYTDVAALRRWVDPIDVAQTALFLASDSSQSITSESIKVDCGRF